MTREKFSARWNGVDVNIMEEARIIDFAEILEGMEVERKYVIAPAVVENFMRAFDDRSPVHVDPARAKARGFSDVVAHGAILGGFVSHFVGMIFPGANSLLLSSDLRFSRPCYQGDELLLRAKVAQRQETERVVVLHIRFHNQTRGVLAATGRLQVKLGGA
jgi:acyl dehydratase